MVILSFVTSEERTLSTEEFARDVEGLASDHDDLLAVEELFCDCAGETTEQVSLAVDDNLIRTRVSNCVVLPKPPLRILRMSLGVLERHLRQARMSTSCPQISCRESMGNRIAEVGEGCWYFVSLVKQQVSQ